MPSATPRGPKTRVLAVFALASMLAINGAHAADGDLDTSFSGDGVNYLEWSGGSADDARLSLGADGKVYVGATTTDTNGDRDFAITRLLANGSLDTAFGYLGYRSVSFDFVADGYDNLQGVFPLADGKLMLLGKAEVPGEIVAEAPPAMVRLTAAGNVDTTFGSGGKLSIGVDQSPWPNASLHIGAVARQPDGKFLFGGYCGACGDTHSAVVLRVDGNGTPDASFGQNGWAAVAAPSSNGLRSMDIDHQGRIILAGNTDTSSTFRPMIVRMTSTGLVDSAFGGGDGVTVLSLPDSAAVKWTATAVAIDRDDALLISVGNAQDLVLYRTALIRLTPNGNYDTSYGIAGFRDLTLEDGSRINALAMRSDRRLVAAGWIEYAGNTDFFVARTLADGSLDNSFDGNGVARYQLSTANDAAHAIVLSASKPVIAGRTNVTGGSGISVLRLQSDLIFADGMD